MACRPCADDGTRGVRGLREWKLWGSSQPQWGMQYHAVLRCYPIPSVRLHTHQPHSCPGSDVHGNASQHNARGCSSTGRGSSTGRRAASGSSGCCLAAAFPALCGAALAQGSGSGLRRAVGCVCCRLRRQSGRNLLWAPRCRIQCLLVQNIRKGRLHVASVTNSGEAYHSVAFLLRQVTCIYPQRSTRAYRSTILDAPRP